MKLHLLILALSVCFLAGCTDSIRLANYDQQDSPITAVAAETEQEPHHLISAFYGLDSEAPFLSNFVVCRGASGKGGMPVIFSHELNLNTLQAGDFRVIKADGSEGDVLCATPAPAFDLGELRTMLMIGDFGSEDNPPKIVEIKGDLLSIDNQINFKGEKIEVTPLIDGPSIILVEQVPEQDWELGKTATRLPFGGGSGCPQGTKQILRVVWNGGITKPGGDEVDDLERNSYQVTVQDKNGNTSTISPFALGDLGDGDNNHKLCLDTEDTPIKVEFPEGLMTDPRDDLNPKTEVVISNIETRKY